MEESVIFIAIILMSLVTMGPRAIPMWWLAGKNLPKPVLDWLKFVPVSVMAAMVAPEIFLQKGNLSLGGSNLFFWMAIPTFLVAILTRTLFIPLIVGMGGLAMVRLFLV